MLKAPFFKIIYYCCLYFIFLFIVKPTVYAQCAGGDHEITICDITNPTNTAVNLFNYIQGPYQTGGTWTDDMLSGGLNKTTGLLNVQAINESGTYTYTYTVSGVNGCADNTATIKINVGPYAGVSSKASVCGEASSYNLFNIFDTSGSNLRPQSNGHWFNVTSGIPISGSNFNPSAVVQDDPVTIKFTYTVDQVDTCPSQKVDLELTVHPPAFAGTPVDINLCSTDDLTKFTNVNLFDQLIGEDEGGKWHDDNATGEITSLLDSTINVEEIYKKFGQGVYGFTYTVSPKNKFICPDRSKTVYVRIETYIDYANIDLTINPEKICFNELNQTTFNATIRQNPVKMPDGDYVINIGLTGSGGSTRVLNFNNGIARFEVPKNNFLQPGIYTLAIVNIKSVKALDICDNNFVIIEKSIKLNPIPNMDTAVLNIDEVCQKSDATVLVENALGLIDGNYTITYSLSGVNAVAGQLAQLVVKNHQGFFVIPGDFLLKDGKTNIQITYVLNNDTGCANTVNLNKDFVVKPRPDVSKLNITASSVCLGNDVKVIVTGLGTLIDINLKYVLSGGNNGTYDALNLKVTNGETFFLISEKKLTNIGETTIAVALIENIANLCSSTVDNIKITFKIHPIPLIPVASDQVFCETQSATITDLSPKGNQYKWYTSLTSTNPLSLADPLVEGSYFVSQYNSDTKCESDRKEIKVSIIKLNQPALIANGDQFCGKTKPKISDLSANTNMVNTIVWYDAPVNGNLFQSDDLLVDQTIYYGFDKDLNSGCLSKLSLQVLVSLSNCDDSNFYVPDGFSPNDDGINDTFHIPDIEFIYPKYTIEIYNRYGNLLFEGNKDHLWDGKNHNSNSLMNGVVPNGIYFNKDNKPTKQGRLYLNR